MQPHSTISYAWKKNAGSEQYRAGVSLHGHTSRSMETLDFIHAMVNEWRVLRPVLRFYERKSLRAGFRLDFASAHWRPPLMPLAAFELECGQIERLGLEPMVSLTDHDTIEAPLLLRNLPTARRIPVSVEWTVPFGRTAFHLGIHNLPSARALEWMERFARFTAAASEGELLSLLQELHEDPQVLIVLNHPLWDLYKIGRSAHADELDRFLRFARERVHALELNGLRNARENAEVVVLARRWQHLLISGGDRHGVEPSAVINLTNAPSFTDFVREIREERRSHMLFMPQYRRAWELRILDSTLDAVVDHPEFMPGWRQWDERAFHLDAEGVMRPMASLWEAGKAPLGLRVAIGTVRVLRAGAVTRVLEAVLPGASEMEELA